ncbi:UDP-N-acetylmuramate dehydrogenase [Xylanibacter muris]|uniref:UDP-N-acetylenolpyruvoylglucosamine reductase n=1 Tax=Xylanibacter muris TaxID=2736290 RepID=A0ABX2AQ99_9BACT|nr:UDP-N-acetylmuramate dehydrogenase [Xylanibacter muris]NPD92395.1 UDP-N-acetylmuramate dehydrogenase [Xylanibacter muris]
MKDIYDYPLTDHNTFGIVAKCHRFIEFCSTDELQTILSGLGCEDYPLLVLGGGSNLLLTKDYPSTVIHSSIKGMEHTAAEDGVLLRVGSGEVWDDVVAYCVSNGWHGAENLSLIPGEVGASAVQNIGAYGSEAKDIIYMVEAMETSTGKTVSFTNAECGYAYRFSKFKGEWKNKYIITYVTYKLSDTFVPNTDYGNIKAELNSRGINNPTAVDLRNVIIDIRNAKLPDPKTEGNAGSFFMNPVVSREKYVELAAEYGNIPHYRIDDRHEKIPAGWLIDCCGWKGRALGRAGVHDKQALVLVNKGGADGTEILNLCNAVRRDVMDKFGIDIHPEVNIV